MKKFVFTLLAFLFIIITEIVFARILPYNLRPNLWIAYITFASLFFAHQDAVVIGFIAGMIYDILHLKIFGVNILVFTSIGYLTGWLNRFVNETLPKVQVLVLILSTVVYLILYHFILFLLGMQKFPVHNIVSILPTSVIGFLALRLFYKVYNSYFL